MLVQRLLGEAHFDPARQSAQAEPTAYINLVGSPHMLQVAFDRIAVSIAVSPEPCTRKGGPDLVTVTRVNRPADEVVRVHVVSALLYDHLDKLQGQTSPDKVLVVDPHCVRDPTIERLMWTLIAANEVEKDLGALYVDAICLALVTRLLGIEHDFQLPATSRRPVALPKWRLKRVFDYIDLHLAGPITAADMAGAAGLTRMHFAAQFRVATGMRPHEYVLRQRVGRAQVLLRGSSIALVDVALSVGFQTQAHFTTVFRRFAHETPHRWRRAALDVPSSGIVTSSIA